MKSSILLDSAVFQLTPTRTRCDLIIYANGKAEKIASGLLNPFLAHLKTAQKQMDKGGYSIILEPEQCTDATWFTKGTVEKFVRFVSTPEILERVYTTESEILQLEEAIAIQSNNDLGLSVVEDHPAKPVESIEGSKPVLDTNEEKAIVLYKPGAPPPEANGSAAKEGNSKVQLLRVLETRKTMLQKEQGMAFARAVAAGFDVDNMAPLTSFAECFGASRLMDACFRFMELWKRKHETGQWLEIEAPEAMSNRSELSAMNASGIILSNVAIGHKEWSDELASENERKTRIEASAEGKPPLDHQVPPGYPENVQGQFPNQMFPPWPMHSPSTAVPVFQAYPMQGMPYYQNYPGNSPYFQPPYPSAEDPRLNVGQRMGLKRHSLDNMFNNTETRNWEMDASKARSQDDLELDESLQSRELQKKPNRSGKKQSGMVVIRNINYITSKRQNSSGSESQSTSEPGSDEEEGLEVSTPEMKHKSALRSSKRKESKTKSMRALNSYDKEEATCGNEADGGHWQAFQNFLLKDADEDQHAVDRGMFSMEKEVQVRRPQNTVGDDPLVFGGRDAGVIQEGNGADMHKISGNLARMPKASKDPFLISGRDGHFGESRIDGQLDVQSAEIDRRGGYRRTTNDDFLIRRRENQSGFTIAHSDPLAVNGFERGTNNLDRSSHNMDDDSYIVPYRSVSLDQVASDGRNAIDMDSEFPSTHGKAENSANRIGGQANYEPDDLSMMPERRSERGSIGYDPALDYEMQVRAEDGSLDKRSKEVVTDVKQGSKKSDKDWKSKLTPDTLDKKKTGGPIRKGKPSKLSPLDEARARAERLRSFKSDLQKVKKEKEEEEIKRLEALKIERQKRIAAKSGSKPVQSPLSSQLTRKQMPTKFSPGSHKGSKFIDTEPGSSSPLRRFSVTTPSVGSSDSKKASKPSRLNAGNHSTGNGLSRSVSSLSEPKKDNSGVTPDTKASMARIRRLSEPKMSSGDHVSSVKSRSVEPVSKSKISNGPESKKISAIINLDKSKAATLPELKIRTSKGPDVSQSKSAAKGMTQKMNAGKSSTTSEGANQKRNDDEISYLDDGDDNLVIEKTVVILECEKPSVPAVHAAEEKIGIRKEHYDDCNIGEKAEMVSDYAAIRALVSPLTVDGVDIENNECGLGEHASSNEFGVPNAERELPKFSSNSSAGKPYQAPHARVSSSEDLCTGNSEYGKAPPTNLEIVTTGEETVKPHVSDYKNLKLEKIPEASEKPQVKESSKGLRRLLKFGKKNHSSAAGERNVEADNAGVSGSETHDNAMDTTSSEAVYTLKNLISQDETAITTQKSSRSFSLLSPFRSKTSEKKLTT